MLDNISVKMKVRNNNYCRQTLFTTDPVYYLYWTTYYDIIK